MSDGIRDAVCVCLSDSNIPGCSNLFGMLAYVVCWIWHIIHYVSMALCVCVCVH